jgi:hypothetical protein
MEQFYDKVERRRASYQNWEAVVELNAEDEIVYLEYLDADKVIKMAKTIGTNSF